MLVGEVVQALVTHFKDDPEFHQLVIDLCDVVLTNLGAPDVIPGDPFDGVPGNGTETGTANASNRLVDLRKGG
jgi:hypothetical protein